MTRNQRIFKQFVIKVVLKMVDIASWIWNKVKINRKVKIETLSREHRRAYQRATGVKIKKLK